VTDLKITFGPKPTFSAVSIPLFLFQSYNNSLATRTVLIYSYAIHEAKQCCIFNIK
jgi:hypothetical protein